MFKTKIRTLYFDSNGNKAGGRTRLARFTNKVSLKHTDIAVI